MPHMGVAIYGQQPSDGAPPELGEPDEESEAGEPPNRSGEEWRET